MATRTIPITEHPAISHIDPAGGDKIMRRMIAGKALGAIVELVNNGFDEDSDGVAG